MTAVLPQTTIPAAGTYVSPVWDAGGKCPKLISFFLKFLYGAGGTSINVYIQTSLDGVTFFDSVAFSQITTSAGNQFWSIGPPGSSQTGTLTDGALGAGTAKAGFLGRYWRIKYIVVGTYTGASSLEVDGFGSY